MLLQVPKTASNSTELGLTQCTSSCIVARKVCVQRPVVRRPVVRRGWRQDAFDQCSQHQVPMHVLLWQCWAPCSEPSWGQTARVNVYTFELAFQRMHRNSDFRCKLRWVQ